MLFPYYIPYNLSDHVKDITLIRNTNNKPYSAVSIDFDDNTDIQTFFRNFDVINYVYGNTGTHTLRLSAYYSGGTDVQLATIKIYDNFEPFDTSTFFDYISATTNNYSLPGSRTQLVQSNDWVTADNINAAFLTLSENLSYLENLCHRPDFRGDETLIAWLGTSDLNWINFDYSLLGSNNNDFISTFGNQLLQITTTDLDYLSAVGFDNIVDLAVQDDSNLGNKLYIIDGTSVAILSSDVNATLMLSTNNIQFNKTFGTPNSIDVDSLGNIYVADTSNNEVYKFRFVNNQLVLQTSVGGLGTNLDNYRVNVPNHVRIDSNDRVIISDRDNYAIKIYDNLLNWVNTINLDTSYGKVLALAVDKQDDSIFVITNTKFLQRYDKDGNISIRTLLPVVNINIVQAFTEFAGNYLYVVCIGSIYKFTRDGLFLRVMSVPVNDTQAINETTTGRSDLHNQTIIGTRTKIFRIDSTPPLLNIRPYTQSLYYDFDSIKIQPKEGVEDWVYNRALNRMIHNHIVFARNIFAKFIRGVNTANTLEYFVLGNRNFDEILTFELSDDLYIGMNEPVLVNVVNRALGTIYDFQIKALSAISPEITTLFTTIPDLDINTVIIPTPTPTPTVIPTPTPTPTPSVTPTPPPYVYITFFGNTLGSTSAPGIVQIKSPVIGMSVFTTIPYGSSVAVPPGTNVDLRAVADMGSTFSTWSVHTQYLSAGPTVNPNVIETPAVSIVLVAEFV